MKVGTRVRVDGASFGSGIVTAVLPKTSDKIDDRFAVPFPQTERRELYAIIAPDNRMNGSVHPEAVAQHEQPTSCDVGQWVTVTKDDGIVPSMSVTWRRFETLMTSWSDKKVPSERMTPAKAHVKQGSPCSQPRSAQPRKARIKRQSWQIGCRGPKPSSHDETFYRHYLLFGDDDELRSGKQWRGISERA
jgi:hypothetical protein